MIEIEDLITQEVVYGWSYQYEYGLFDDFMEVFPDCILWNLGAQIPINLNNKPLI